MGSATKLTTEQILAELKTREDWSTADLVGLLQKRVDMGLFVWRDVKFGLNLYWAGSLVSAMGMGDYARLRIYDLITRDCSANESGPDQACGSDDDGAG